MAVNMFDNEYIRIKGNMEKMGVDSYLRMYPPRTQKMEAIIYHIAMRLRERQIADMKELINTLHDKIDYLTDELFTLKN
jgi:hypothetical protein